MKYKFMGFEFPSHIGITFYAEYGCGGDTRMCIPVNKEYPFTLEKLNLGWVTQHIII